MVKRNSSILRSHNFFNVIFVLHTLSLLLVVVMCMSSTWPLSLFASTVINAYQSDIQVSFFTTWWQQRAHLTLVFPLSFSLPCVFRGRWKPAGYGRCCRTSTRLLWAPARLLSFAPRQAVWAAWNPGHFPPWHMATMLGWPLWGRWCSAWPLRVAWPCKRILFNSNGPLMHVQLDSGCKSEVM